MTYISVDEVRNRSGAPTSLVSDTQITEFIAQVEPEMARWLNTAFVPTEIIEIRDGNSMSIIFARKNPILSIRKLVSNGSTNITPAYLNWHKPSGKILLTSSAEAGVFISGSQNTFIKYIYGLLNESSTKTATIASAIVGTTISLSVSSITDFVDKDWVEIYGMDGHREVAQITGVPTGSTIVDEIVKTHESGSVVVKLQIPEFIKNYMMIEAAICVAINAIGATYVFNASYNLGDLQVTKGVPYTHWRESVNFLLKERAMRRATIRIRPSILVD